MMSWGSITNGIKFTGEKKFSTLSQLMDDESTAEENAEEVCISSDCPARICKTIFMFPAIMEIREQRAKVVTVGLYHHKESMLFGHDFKWKIVNLMIHAFKLDMRMFFRNVERREAELLGCYEEEFEGSCPMNSDEFRHMLLADGCFVLFALRCFSGRQSRLLPDMVELFRRKLLRVEEMLMYDLMKNLNIIVSRLEMHQESVICDLLLLENQIPFPVLKELVRACDKATNFVGSSIKDLALSCFKNVHPKVNNETSESPEDFLHLLDVFHWSRVPKDKYKIDSLINSQTSSDVRVLPAAALHLSGMKFKKNTDSSLDIEIKSLDKSYVIEMPTIDINNYRFSIFESLVTFERRYKERGFGFSAFIECMASLLQSDKDIKLLQKCGIIPKCTEATDDYVLRFFYRLNRCINPVALMPHPYEVYKNAMDRVRETVGTSQAAAGPRCWFRL